MYRRIINLKRCWQLQQLSKRLMFHIMIFYCFFQGSVTDIQIKAEEMLKMKRQVNDLYVRHTKRPLCEIGTNCYLCIDTGSKTHGFSCDYLICHTLNPHFSIIDITIFYYCDLIVSVPLQYLQLFQNLTQLQFYQNKLFTGTKKLPSSCIFLELHYEN